MDTTRVTQECHHVIDSGGQLKYRIRTTVDPTQGGELPHFHIFVYQTGQEDDPKTDVFTRVATPHDLQNYPLDRLDAFATDAEGAFLSPSMEVFYDDLDIAIQAKAAIVSRINNLINTWITYKDSFYTDPEVESFYPTVDPGLELALKNAYYDARTARIVAEAESTAAVSAESAAEAAVDAAVAIVAIYDTEVQFCMTARVAYWAAVQAQINALASASNTFKTEAKTFLETDIGKNSSLGMFQDLVNVYNQNINGDTTIWPNVPTDTAKNYLYSAINTTLGAAGALQAFMGGPYNTYNDAYEQWIAASPVVVQLDSSFQTFCLQAASGYASAMSAQSAAYDTLNDAVKEKEKAEATVSSAQEAEDEALDAVQEVCPDFEPLVG